MNNLKIKKLDQKSLKEIQGGIREDGTIANFHYPTNNSITRPVSTRPTINIQSWDDLIFDYPLYDRYILSNW